MVLSEEQTLAINYLRTRNQTRKKRPLLKACTYLLRGYKSSQRNRRPSTSTPASRSPSTSKA